MASSRLISSHNNLGETVTLDFLLELNIIWVTGYFNLPRETLYQSQKSRKRYIKPSWLPSPFDGCFPGLGLTLIEAAVSDRDGRQLLHGVELGSSLSLQAGLQVE